MIEAVNELLTHQPTIRFSKYHSMGVDVALVADPDDRLGVLSEHVAGLSSRGFGIGCVAMIRVMRGENGADIVVDDGATPAYGSVWRSPSWDAVLRSAVVFARDEGLVTSRVINVLLRSSDVDHDMVSVEALDDALVRLEVGAPTFGFDNGSTGATADLSPAEIDVPSGFDPSDDWWAVREEVDLTLPVYAVTLRDRLHAVVFKSDVNRIFRYVGPSSCLAPGMAGGPTKKLVSGSGPFAGVDDRPILDILDVSSPSQIEVDGEPAWRNEVWPQGDGPCAAASVARRLALVGDATYAPSGFGEVVIEWNGSTQPGAPIKATAAAEKIFDGQLSDLGGSARARNRSRLQALLP